MKKSSHPDEVKHVVALIHGIRTRAEWADMVKAELAKVEIEGCPLHYGFFNLFQFLAPFGTRHRPIDRILRELQDLRVLYPNARISVIAHSFGTYVITEILRRQSHIRIDKLLLCGGIVPTNFHWAMHEAQLGWDETQKYQAVNECGNRDIWAVLASSVTWGYGASGTFGFGAARVRDRYHGGRYNAFRHSDYFDPAFVRKYWIPYLDRGEIVGTEWEAGRVTAPWWMNVLALLPFNWIIFVLLPLAISLCSLNRIFDWGMPLPCFCSERVTVRGTIVDAESGIGLGDAQVVIRNLEQEGKSLSAIADNTGGFHFPKLDLRRGVRLQIQVKHQGYDVSISNPIVGTGPIVISLIKAK